MKSLIGPVVLTATLLLSGCGGSQPQTAEGYKQAVMDKYGKCLEPTSLRYYPSVHTVGAKGKPTGLFWVFKVSGDRDHTKVEDMPQLHGCSTS